MADTARSDLSDRLRLVDSLLGAAGDGLSSLQRLIAEVSHEMAQARREEEEGASRDEEIQALRREVEQLREGMASRAVIERAKGILMHAHALSESQSFDLLTEVSQSRHRKLREVAAEIANGSPLPVPGAQLPGAQLPATQLPGAVLPGAVAKPHLVRAPDQRSGSRP